jgi:DNA-binding response OmpR family regulator
MRILYIEDNDDNVYVMRSRLGRAGFTVLVAVDAEQGQAMAAAETAKIQSLVSESPRTDIQIARSFRSSRP